MPIARVAGCNTRAGRLMIEPAGRPQINPSATVVAITAPLRGSVIISIANTMQPATMISSGRLVRSARKPPAGTESTVNHSTMLMADPAVVIDHPRSTSIEGPKLKIVAKPTLYKLQIEPAAITAMTALRSRRAVAAVATTELTGGWYKAARSMMPHPISAATARYTAPTP